MTIFPGGDFGAIGNPSEFRHLHIGASVLRDAVDGKNVAIGMPRVLRAAFDDFEFERK